MTSHNKSEAFYWEGDISARPLKVAIVREEFVALTQDPLIAIVLNQLLYWTRRVKDFDQFLEEEKNYNPECNVLSRHGWIYKTAEDLISETMLHVNRTTMRRYLKLLIDRGWVEERANDYKFNKTTQYRMNLRKLQDELLSLGYSLPGFSNVGREESSYRLKSAETSNVQNAPSRVQNAPSDVQVAASSVQNAHSYTYTEITTETTNRDHTPRAHDFQKVEKKDTVDLMISIWKNYIGQDVVLLNAERKQGVRTLLNLYFKNDLNVWESFCKRIQDSPFLMGQGANKWHINFDWILAPGNALKVLEGNYDKPELIQKKKAAESKKFEDEEKQSLLNSIQDSTWKNWCSSIRDELSSYELKSIANARFLELEGRLVWIESTNKAVLNKIDDLWLTLIRAVQKTYPNVSAIRTKLKNERLSQDSSTYLNEIIEDSNSMLLHPFQPEEVNHHEIKNSKKTQNISNFRKEIAC